MYNNEITYADKWNTPENLAALKKLQRKYFDKSECGPDCPVAWAPEVLELFEKLDKELGFRHNASTIRGYYVRGNLLEWFIVSPFKSFFSSVHAQFFSENKKRLDRKTGALITKTLKDKVVNVVEATFHPIQYGYRALKMRFVNPLLNKIFDKKISLGQLKEKYGSLTVYFSCADVFDEYVEREIRKCELKLALKGAYYPVESFWNAGVGTWIGTDYSPDIITTKDETDSKGKTCMSIHKTQYRNLMKEMGLNLEDIQKKAEILKASGSNTP